MNNTFVGDVLSQAMKSVVDPLLTKLVEQNEAWYSREITQYLSFNTMYHTIFGRQAERNSKLVKELVEDFDQAFRMAPIDMMLRSSNPLFKLLRHFPIAQKVLKVRNRRNSNIQKLVEMRLDDKKNNDDGIETYVDYMHSMVDETSSNHKLAV